MLVSSLAEEPDLMSDQSNVQRDERRAQESTPPSCCVLFALMDPADQEQSSIRATGNVESRACGLATDAVPKEAAYRRLCIHHSGASSATLATRPSRAGVVAPLDFP